MLQRRPKICLGLSFLLCTWNILFCLTSFPGVQKRLDVMNFVLQQKIHNADLWFIEFFSEQVFLEPASDLTITQCKDNKLIMNRDKGSTRPNFAIIDNRELPPIIEPTKFPDEGSGSGGDVIAMIQPSINSPITIALACGITTRRLDLSSNKTLGESMQFFTDLLPSFCATASIGYRYVFYIAYDFDDQVLSRVKSRADFLMTFREATCSPLCANVHAELKMVRCEHRGKPARAQNDAMMAAYADGADYLYMTNDDTLMASGGWTQVYIDTLRKMSPPNIGVVGPNHSGGNLNILTYHFLHRTHVDIFKYFYPPNFTDWHGDWWITTVYKPDYSRKIRTVRLDHTMKTGTRYVIHEMSDDHLESIRNVTRLQLKNYLASRGYELNGAGLSLIVSPVLLISSLVLLTSLLPSNMLPW